jgi:hypothetical protein
VCWIGVGLSVESDSQRGSSAQLEMTPGHRTSNVTTPVRPTTIPRNSRRLVVCRTDLAPQRGTSDSPNPVQSSFGRRKSSASSHFVPELRRASPHSSTSSENSNSSAAALRLYQQHLQQPPQETKRDDEEEVEPAFLPLTRPATANKDKSSTLTVPTSQTKEAESKDGSDSFSDLSDASISNSALEEALADHIRRGGSVAASQMPQGAVRSIWKGKFTG